MNHNNHVISKQKRLQRIVTAQVIESKSDKHFEWAKNELDTNEERYATKKVAVIRELASRLEEEGEIETNKVSREITKRLKKYVTSRYVQEVLDDKYKDQKHAESRRTNSSKRAQVDVSEDDIIAKDEPQEQGAAAIKPVEHDRREALVLENSELKEALKRQTTLLSADQVSANEITFIVPKEKFNQLKEAMEISRDSIRLVFDKSGMLECAESDIFERRQLTRR